MKGPTVLQGSVTMPANLLTLSGPYSLHQHDATGSKSVSMTPVGRSFCFLTLTAQADLNLPSEVTICKIVQVNNTWILIAELEASNDANSWCEARCVSW